MVNFIFRGKFSQFFEKMIKKVFFSIYFFDRQRKISRFVLCSVLVAVFSSFCHMIVIDFLCTVDLNQVCLIIYNLY